jgi:hypothetical protein
MGPACAAHGAITQNTGQGLHDDPSTDTPVAGGKTSTLTQFAELARHAGLEVLAARHQSTGRFVVELGH